MAFRKIDFKVVEGVTEGITYGGGRKRRNTVLIKVGRHSFSKKAFQLGLLLAIFQILDGGLTYIGLLSHGIEMEGNTILHRMMSAYGLFPALFIAKSLALTFVVVLTVLAHRRRWIRPFLIFLSLVYLLLAVIPWVYIISAPVH